MKAIIKGDKIWKNLAGIEVSNKIIEISDCYDNHFYIKEPILKNGEIFLLNSCSKNFINYCDNNKILSNAKEIHVMNTSSFPYSYHFTNFKLNIIGKMYIYSLNNKFSDISTFQIEPLTIDVDYNYHY